MDDPDADADADPGPGAEEGGEREAAGHGPHPFDPSNPLLEHWDELMGDAAATAEVYREDGWDVLLLHPGDVTALAEPDEFGLDVLVPDDEFDELEAWVAEGRFEEFEVYRAESGMVFLLVVTCDESNRRAVCLPAYYGFEAVPGLAGRAEREGRFLTHVRRLDGERVTFTHDDPSPFFPGTGTDEADEGDERSGERGQSGANEDGTGADEG